MASAWVTRARSTRWSSNSIVPPSDFSKKFKQRSIVVFPLPLGPKMATTSPLFTSRSMLLSTCKSPKDLRRFLICSIVQLLCAPLLLRYRSPTACRRVSTVQNSR